MKFGGFHSKLLGTPQSGFSLIELMIVVGIIGVLATMAQPKYKDMQCRAKEVSLMQCKRVGKTKFITDDKIYPWSGPTPDFSSVCDWDKAAEMSCFSNCDVNRDGTVNGTDAILVVNLINQWQAQNGFDARHFDSKFFYDVSGDGRVTALDALRIINRTSCTKI